MGYRRAGFAFHGRGYADPDAVRRWLAGDVIERVLLAPLERGGYLGRVAWVSRNLGDPEPIESLDDLRARADTWGHEVVSLFAGDRHDPDWEIFLGLDSDGPRVRVGIPLDGVCASLRDDVAAWVSAWSEGLAAVGVCFATGAFAPDNRPYPRPVPPRSDRTWEPGALDLYAGRTWHAARDDRATVLAGLDGAPLPPGARRTHDAHVSRVAFDADLDDPEAVAAARAAQERWLTPLVPAKVEPGWNERGDRGVAPSRPTVRPPFTLFDEFAQVGYRALAVFPPDGALDEDAWAQLSVIARAGALPDGTPVRAVRLILPRREDALAVHARAMACGFEMATYPEGSAFWAVDPALAP